MAGHHGARGVVRVSDDERVFVDVAGSVRLRGESGRSESWARGGTALSFGIWEARQCVLRWARPGLGPGRNIHDCS